MERKNYFGERLESTGAPVDNLGLFGSWRWCLWFLNWLFSLFLAYNIEGTHKTIVEIVYNTPEIILKQIFTKKFSPFWPFDVILTQEIALFEHYEQIFADFCLFINYNMEITP